MKPEFPIVVRFAELQEEWVFEDKAELACTLEWFDSNDVSEKSQVLDAKGRRVTVKVERLQLLVFELSSVKKDTLS